MNEQRGRSPRNVATDVFGAILGRSDRYGIGGAELLPPGIAPADPMPDHASDWFRFRLRPVQTDPKS